MSSASKISGFIIVRKLDPESWPKLWNTTPFVPIVCMNIAIFELLTTSKSIIEAQISSFFRSTKGHILIIFETLCSAMQMFIEQGPKSLLVHEGGDCRGRKLSAFKP